MLVSTTYTRSREEQDVDDDYDVNKQCVLCNIEDIGDEFHYILKCDKFK